MKRDKGRILAAKIWWKLRFLRRHPVLFYPLTTLYPNFVGDITAMLMTKTQDISQNQLKYSGLARHFPQLSSKPDDILFLNINPIMDQKSPYKTKIVTPHVIPSAARDLLSCGTIFKESIDTSRSILGSMH